MLWLAVTGCVKEVSGSGSAPEENFTSRDRKTRPAQYQDNSRELASQELSRQAMIFLDTGEPDRAIRQLERAINLNPGNGQSYYYLSEAWLAKGDAEQAKEFNRLAELYLKDDPDWSVRLIRQSDRIRELEKQVNTATDEKFE